MKKTISFILCVAMLFAVCVSLGSCFRPSEENVPDPNIMKTGRAHHTICSFHLAYRICLDDTGSERTIHSVFASSDTEGGVNMTIHRIIAAIPQKMAAIIS